MAVNLTLSSKELDNEDIQELTTDLCQTIVKETDIDAKIPEGPSQAGVRGEPITLGLLALTFLGGGSAVALFNVFKSYFDRESSLKLDLQREDGTTLTINAQNMKPEQIEDTLTKFEKFLEKSG
jgi:hypothetical protein